MSMDTNLQGRLRNTSLPYSHGLLPLFEAVLNSIHSIEEAAHRASDGSISIEIVRDTQVQLQFEANRKKPGPDTKGDIVGFRITDNGIGFTDANMTSFLTLDSEYKASKGGRGVGRLLWLKAFKMASVRSAYESDNGKLQTRTFSFKPEAGVCDENTEDASDSQKTTCVHLHGFAKKYRDASPKTARVIANNLLEHCLWYFVRDGGAPKIEVLDGDETIDLDTVYEDHMVSSATTDTLEVKDTPFELIHIRLRAHSGRTHMIALCAANRVVKEESIRGKIPGLFGNLHDEAGEFVYACYVSSPLLDERVRSERTSFDIEEEPLALQSKTEVSQQDIRDGVISKVAEHLSEYLDENKKKGQERVEAFVSRKAPRYRPILARIPEDQRSIDPNISDKELELVLHKHLAEIEGKLLADGHDVMNPKPHESYPEYRKRLQEYLKTAEDIKKSDLANYVSHRKVILDLLEMAIKKRSDGKYEREELLHSLIMPMRSDSTELMFDSCNLWLVDERLAFHDYLASDKPLSSMPITDSRETTEPDILALNVFDNPILVAEGTKLPLTSIVVVELKKPMRNDAAMGEKKDPIEQALGYLDRIRRGKIQTASGRPIPNSEDVAGFCYAICDITSSVEKRCKILGLTPTHDHLGYFGYNPNYKAYLEVISFDRLVNAAKERNRAFFDKLGLPTT